MLFLLFSPLAFHPPDLTYRPRVLLDGRCTRAGKVLGLNEARSCNVSNYKYVGEPWSSRLLYRTLETLQVIIG